nr:glycosyltransferase [Chromatium okenii]
MVGDLALRFPDTIRYYRHEIRLGPAGNYQFLIERSKGEYIAHLDGDDYWLPGKLKAQSKRLDDEPDCPAIYSNALCINDEGCLLGLFNNLQPDRFDLMGLLKRGNFLNHSSMLYRACYRGELLSWTPDFIDYRIHLYLSRFGNIGYLNAPFVGYRINSSGSMVVHQNDKVRLFYWIALCDIPPPLVRPEDLSKGMAEFMRSIFFRSVRIRSMHLLKIWWPRILDQAPAGRARLIAQACWSILRTATTEDDFHTLPSTDRQHDDRCCTAMNLRRLIAPGAGSVLPHFATPSAYLALSAGDTQAPSYPTRGLTCQGWWRFS